MIKIIKYIASSLVMALMIVMIFLSVIRYQADTYFNHAMRMKLERNIDAHIESAKKAVALNPYVLNYTNVLGLTYLQTAIKSLPAGRDFRNTGNDRQETTKWFVNAIHTAERVQELYPEEYYSACMLREAYMALDRLSNDDMSEYIAEYNKIAISARPYRDKRK